MDVIELNEAFAAQGLAVLRSSALPTTMPRQSERRRHRAGAPARRRRAAGDHGGEPAASHGWPLRAVHHVHWCGQGIAVILERV